MRIKNYFSKYKIRPVSFWLKRKKEKENKQKKKCSLQIPPILKTGISINVNPW